MLTEKQKKFLSKVVSTYIWWKTPEEALMYPHRIVAQVMNRGFWDDVCELVTCFSDQELMNVLNQAEVGQFNAKSWCFWHIRLGHDDIPPMPERILQ